MYYQKEGLLYVSGFILNEQRLAALKQKGFRIIVSNDMKWAYLRTDTSYWRKYIEVTNDLDQFLGIEDPVEVR
jgi:hypothetical protein